MERFAPANARPDRRWHAAALTGLAAVGDSDARKELLEILADDRHPLTADAAAAAGVVGDVDLLLPLARLVQSRNKQIARASLLALRRYLSDVRSSPRGLAAAEMDQVQRTTAEEPDADLNDRASSSPSAELPAETRAAIVALGASLGSPHVVDAARAQTQDLGRSNENRSPNLA